MSYQKMKISDMHKELVGYLSMTSDWTTYAAIIVPLESARNYKWQDYPDGRRRLDQETGGGDRSLTYSSNGGYPCWGLASNWVYLKYGEDHSISYDNGNGIRFLAQGPWNQGPERSPFLVWAIPEAFGNPNWVKLAFELV